jgi:hypothetical protein
MKDAGKEHSFSIEMKSKNHVKRITLSNNDHEGVLFEGNLGEIERLAFVNGILLEIKGVNGVLRVDLSQRDLAKNFVSLKEEEEVIGYEYDNRARARTK